MDSEGHPMGSSHYRSLFQLRDIMSHPTLSLREFERVCVELNAPSDVLFYSTHPLATERWDGQVG